MEQKKGGRRLMTTHDRYGHFVPVYTARRDGQPILLDCGYLPHELLARGWFRVTAYITRELQLVEAVGPAWDVPDTILVKFDGGEAVTKEAHRLTVELWETVAAKFTEFERQYLAGGSGVAADVYRDALARVERVEKVWGRTVKVYNFAETA